MDWISVKEKPLFINTPLGWECTDEGTKEFLAALEYEDTRRPGVQLWWVRHCVVEDGVGLCVVGDDDNTPAGWELKDVTHYMPFPNPPKN